MLQVTSSYDYSFLISKHLGSTCTIYNVLEWSHFLYAVLFLHREKNAFIFLCFPHLLVGFFPASPISSQEKLAGRPCHPTACFLKAILCFALSGLQVCLQLYVVHRFLPSIFPFFLLVKEMLRNGRSVTMEAVPPRTRPVCYRFINSLCSKVHLFKFVNRSY